MIISLCVQSEKQNRHWGKINRNLSAIKRSRQCITVDSTIIALYRILIEPYLRYCCNVWKLWQCCGNALLHRLQTLQNRAVRVITKASFKNADHEQLLKRLNLLFVEQIIQFDNLCVIYNIVNGSAATNAMDLFQPAEKLTAMKVDQILMVNLR